MSRIRRGTAEDLPAVRALLNEAHLPGSGLDACVGDLLVVESRDAIVGAVALERAGGDALLRSLVVRPGERGSGLGDALTREIVARAREEGVRELWLLTETADTFFEQRGFERAVRSEAPAGVRQTEEFRSLCPDSAVAMRLVLS